MKLTTTAMLLLMLILTGCNKDTDSYDELIEDGWHAYSNGNYELAASRFMDATHEDGSRAEAWNGLGWSQIELFEDEQSDENYLTGIDNNFQEAVSISDSWSPPLAGLSYTRSRLGESLSAIHFAGLALGQAGDGWVYSRIEEVTGRSLRRVRAWNYFLVEDFAAAQTEVELVLEVTLDPNDPDYLAQLLAYIEQI
jgi:hypothetical protein